MLATKIEQLCILYNGIGEYAYVAFTGSDEEKFAKGNEMLSCIENIAQNAIEYNSPELYYHIAIAYRNYCGFFIRGEDRSKFLEICLEYLRAAIELDSSFLTAKAELGHLLINEKVIRNLKEGINLLEELEAKKVLPFYLYSTLARGKRQIGDIKLSRKYNLKHLDITPAGLREERKRLRVLIKKYKTDNNDEKLKIALTQIYKLAFFAVICYQTHDCKAGVAGIDFDQAIKLRKQIPSDINVSYQENGYITYCNFLSINDWKSFINVYGNTNKICNPFTIIGIERPKLNGIYLNSALTDTLVANSMPE